MLSLYMQRVSIINDAPAKIYLYYIEPDNLQADADMRMHIDSSVHVNSCRTAWVAHKQAAFIVLSI